MNNHIQISGGTNHKVITDGIGTPDPTPIDLVKWCF